MRSIYALCGLVRRKTTDARENVWPPILGLFRAVVVTLTYLRRNRVQAELAETFGVSQPTISRAISGLTPVLGRVLGDYRKPAGRNLLDWEQKFNKQVDQIRYRIERTIANFKSWRQPPAEDSARGTGILRTDYRRPLATFTTTISTVIVRHFYKICSA